MEFLSAITVDRAELSEAALEERFGLKRKLAALEASEPFDLDGYLAGGEALLELLGRARNERDALQRTLEEMRNSRSWRITRPLRRARHAWTRWRR